MLRGEISARPQPICAVDFKLLLEPRYEYSWYGLKLGALLWESNHEALVHSSIVWKDGAVSWLERNWERRFLILSVGVPDMVPAIDMVAKEKVAETEHFYGQGDLKTWLPGNPEVYRLYTNDAGLLGLDTVTKRLSGWSERA